MTVSIESAVIAVAAGVRMQSCMMPVPSLSVSVRAARNAIGAIASMPHASALHAESTPSFSASVANASIVSNCSRPPVVGPPTRIAVFIRSGSGRAVR